MRSIKNTAIVFLSMVFAGLLKLGYTVSGAQFLGIEFFASLIICLSLISVITSFSMLGCHVGIVRYLQKDSNEVEGDNIIVWGFLLVFIIATILSCILFFASNIFASAYKKEFISIVLKSAAVGVPFLVLAEFGSFIFRARRKHKAEVVSRVLIPQILIVSLVFWGASTSPELLLKLLAVSWVLLGFTVTYLALRGVEIKRQFEAPIEFPLSYFRYSIPLAIMPIANRLNAEFYILLIGFFADSESVVIFALALRLANQITVLPKAVNVVMQPRIARFYAVENLESLSIFYEKISRYSIFITTPLVIAVLSTLPLIQSYFDIAISDNFLVVAFILVANYIHTSMGINGMMLRMGGWSTSDFKISIVEILLTIFGGILFSNYLGLLGVGLSYMLVKITVNVLRTICVYRLTGLTPFSRLFRRAAVFSILVLGIVFLVSYLFKNILLISLLYLALLSFLIFYYATHASSVEERRGFYNLFKKLGT